MNTKHTPTPWRVSQTYQGAQGEYETTIQDTDGLRIITVEAWKGDAQKEAESNAEFIVKAVNAHDDLVAVLEDLLCCTELNLDDIENSTRRTIETAVAVIAKAKG